MRLFQVIVSDQYLQQTTRHDINIFSKPVSACLTLSLECWQKVTIEMYFTLNTTFVICKEVGIIPS